MSDTQEDDPSDDWSKDTTKLPPRTVSSWVNVYPCDDVEADGVDLSPPYPDRIEADACAGSNRSHVIRVDLTDGKLSVEVEQ